MSDPHLSADLRDEFNTDDDNLSTGSSLELPEDYPPCAQPGNTAKDWDVSILQNCTAARMKSIAKHYPGVDPRATKIPLYRAIFDAMNDNQECSVCGSKCNPLTHVF